MKIQFQKNHVLFTELGTGSVFSTKEEPNKLFIKISGIHDTCRGELNCIDLADGRPSCFTPTGRVIPKNATVVVE